MFGEILGAILTTFVLYLVILGVKALLLFLFWNTVLISWLGLGLPSLGFALALFICFVIDFIF